MDKKTINNLILTLPREERTFIRKSRGKCRELKLRAIIERKQHSEEIEQAIQIGKEEGIQIAKGLAIKGFHTRPDCMGGFIINKEPQILKISKIKRRSMILEDIPKELIMEIPIIVNIHINHMTEFCGVSITRPDFSEINLFHSNSNMTCFGTMNSKIGQEMTPELAEQLTKDFMETMSTINLLSMYSVDKEIIHTKRYLQNKYLGSDWEEAMTWSEETCEERAERAMLNRAIINNAYNKQEHRERAKENEKERLEELKRIRNEKPVKIDNALKRMCCYAFLIR